MREAPFFTAFLLANGALNCYNDIQLNGRILRAPQNKKGKTIMPTIIERIAAAEADAEALKRNAREAAAGAQAAAEDDAAKSLKIAREEAKAGLALSGAMARKEAEAEAGRLLAEGREQAKALLAEAEGRVPEAAKAVVEAILAGI